MKRYVQLSIILTTILLTSAGDVIASEAQPRDYFEESNQMAWREDARFGMMFHWGLYAGGEHNGKRVKMFAEDMQKELNIPADEYQKRAETFNPVKFDAQQWVQDIANTGAKYVVITARHREGFCMYDTDVDVYKDYNIVTATPFKRDVFKELSDACRKKGIRFGFYYNCKDKFYKGSEYEYPEYRDKVILPQLTELMTKYGEIGTIWFDNQPNTKEEKKILYNHVHNLQPNVITNIYYEVERQGDAAGNPPPTMRPFEQIGSIPRAWGHVVDGETRTTESCLTSMISAVAKNGSYLLNVGPTAEGEFPADVGSVMSKIGTWLKINGESIYGAGGTLFGIPEWGFYTIKLDPKKKWKGTVYLHLITPPESGEIELPRFSAYKMFFSNARVLGGLGEAELVLKPGVKIIDVDSLTPPKNVPLKRWKASMVKKAKRIEYTKVKFSSNQPDVTIPVIAIDYDGGRF